MGSLRVWSALIVLLVVLFGANEVLAQRRGGSFGGGSFGRSGSSGSRSTGSRSTGTSWGGSRSSGSRSTSWGSSRRSSSSGGTYGAGTRRRSGGGCGFGFGGAFCCFMIVGGIVLLTIISRSRKKGGASTGAAPGATYRGPDAMYVTRLSLGIDWRARRDIQATLQRLAETGDTSSPQGLANLLRETILSLRRAEISWLYVGVEDSGSFAPQAAEQQFNMLAMKARSAFQTEVVRAAGGQVTAQDAPEMRMNSNEGEGTVVVHLILATYRPVQTMQAPDANQIRAALDNRSGLTADQLGALEVVWSPASETDRMSTAELEQFYPDLRLIDPNSIAGRLFCTYCRGPFAMELLSCPHCGAPAEASQGNRAPPQA
ncbi:MAG: DUF1517 domain-containing protein [Sandaracinaceae bacterium]